MQFRRNKWCFLKNRRYRIFSLELNEGKTTYQICHELAERKIISNSNLLRSFGIVNVPHNYTDEQRQSRLGRDEHLIPIDKQKETLDNTNPKILTYNVKKMNLEEVGNSTLVNKSNASISISGIVTNQPKIPQLAKKIKHKISMSRDNSNKKFETAKKNYHDTKVIHYQTYI